MKKDSKLQSLDKLTVASSKAKSLTKPRYTVPELIRITGMTRRQVIYWDKIKLLRPRFRKTKAVGSQPAWFYTPRQVIKALVICDMLDRGLSLQKVRRVIRFLENNAKGLDESKDYLLTDGNTVVYAESRDIAIDILKHEGQMLLVPIQEQIEKLLRAA